MNSEEPIAAAAEISPEPVPHRRLPLLAGALVLVVLWGGLQLWGLGRTPFHTHGEAREALVVWQMTHGGGWILPRRDGPTGIELPSKPPLFHWLAALTALVHGGTAEGSIRLPSAALSLGGVLATYAAGVALWGLPAGMFGAVITMTSFEWQRAATSARVDMALTFGLLGALFSYLFFVRSQGHRRWLVPFYGAMAFATLAKGPVGVALPALVIAASCAVRRDTTPLRQLRLGRGLLAVAVITGLWYLLALIIGGFDFFGKQVLNENLFRMFDATEYEGGHRHGPLYLLGGLAAGFLPWTLFLPGAAVGLWRARRELMAGDWRGYLLLWVAAVFGLYALAVSKRSVYLLALYPALGLLLGQWWASALSTTVGDLEPAWWRAVLRLVALLVAALMLVLMAVTGIEALGLRLVETAGAGWAGEAALYSRWVGEVLHAQPAGILALLAAAAVSLWGLALALRRPGRWALAFAAMVGAACAGSVLTQQIVLPQIAAHKTYRDFMTAVRQVVGQEPIAFHRTFEYVAVFYWGGHLASYQGELTDAAPRYLLMARADWEQLAAPQRGRFERVELPAGLEDGNRRRLLLLRRHDG
ncbi:MAG: glycosyltransferase family 39 protein [Deltaproteobacteria bacterium]|nr:glycosyltransferase family 39 protein [Deltaproteobacteria bacterium]